MSDTHDTSAISAFELLSNGGKAGGVRAGGGAACGEDGPSTSSGRAGAGEPSLSSTSSGRAGVGESSSNPTGSAQTEVEVSSSSPAGSGQVDRGREGGSDAVPSRTPKHGQWTRAKMVAFLRELAACQSVAGAAKAVGMSRQSAYRLRNRLQGTPFSLGWEVALEAGLQQLAHAVLDRALNGVEVPQYYQGELVGTRRQFDERLSIWLLENPWKLGRHQVAREYSAEAFDMLLERIEWASFDWEAGEAVPGQGAPLGAPEEEAASVEGRFMRERSWYAAQVEEARGLRRK